MALARIRIGWRDLYRIRSRHLVLGVVAGGLLYVAGGVVAVLAARVPSLATQMRLLYGWKEGVPTRAALPLVLMIVLAEEIVWRNAVTLPLAARLGPWRGTLAGGAAFAIAHVPLGVPLLVLAALGAGLFWGALVVRTRSAVPAFVSHALLDLLVLFWLPYVRP